MPEQCILTSAARLSAVHELAIVDTPPEPDYDDLAAIASAIFRSPVGAINFVEADRHFTKAIAGAAGTAGTSVPAEQSFCARTVETPPGLLLVPDTHANPVWQDHPLVAGGPEVGFYAGASILSRGERVGVVCSFGPEPHEITDAEVKALEALARQAQAQLEMRLHAARLRELALTDALTGLGNRRLLFESLQLAIAERRSGHEVGVLFCDIDHFKSVNDEHGHEVGDQLLCEVAVRLRELTRERDIVARIAGDEFVIVCPQLAGSAALDEIAQRVEGIRLSRPAGGDAAPSISVGAAMARGGESASDVLRRADEAMYRKKHGEHRAALRAIG